MFLSQIFFFVTHPPLFFLSLSLSLSLFSIPAFVFLHVHDSGCHDGLVSGLNTIGHHGCGCRCHCWMAVLCSDWVVS